VGINHEKKEIIILGVDPGTQITGFGVIKAKSSLIPLDFGCIKPPAKMSLEKRYQVIHEAIQHLIQTHRPDAISVETQFVYKNVQSAIKLGMARGMILLAAAQSNVPIFEYAPKKAKLAVVGTGSASKQQVQKMVQSLLCLPTPPKPEDAADALALAICHAHSYKNSVYQGIL